MKPLVLLDARASVRPVHRDPEIGDRVHVVDLYDLPSTDLAPHAGLVVTAMADQEFLWAQRRSVARFLDDGKVVIFCGHLLRPWLPGCGPFVPAPIASFRDYAVRLTEPRTIFAGVDADDLTFRRGVAGFFARGHHPPPAGAEVLAMLAGGQPTTWIDRSTTAGAVFVHAGDLLSFADKGSTASLVVPRLLDWAVAEGRASCRP
ncbi:MAG: phosphate starvation-inducible protein PhoH [Actinobacteria bacterium]|nr:phosphate starvation-inducible protein PhoH [Actinomycetota bacterium]